MYSFTHISYVYVYTCVCACNTHTRAHTHTHLTTTTTTPNINAYNAQTHTVSGDSPPCPECDSSYPSLMLKNLFAWASCSRTHYEDDCLGISRALGFSLYRHLWNVRVCDRQCSPTSASLLTLFRGDGEMACDVSPIEDDGGTNIKTNDADSTRILRSLLHKSILVRCTSCGSLFLRERRLESFACNINAPTCNIDTILSQYKSKYSKDTVMCLSGLYNS